MESIVDTSYNLNILKNNDDTVEEINSIPDNTNEFKNLSEEDISNKLDDILNETISSFNNNELKNSSEKEINNKLDNILNETIKNINITDKDMQTLDFSAFLNLMKSLPVGNMFGNLNNNESETSCKTSIDENNLDTESESESDLSEYEDSETNVTTENLNNIFDPSKLFGDNANSFFNASLFSNIIEKMSNKDTFDEKNKIEIMEKMVNQFVNMENLLQNLGMGNLSNITNSVNENSELDELQNFLIDEEENNSKNENSDNENSDNESYDQTDDEFSNDSDDGNESKNDEENKSNFLNQFNKFFNLNFLTTLGAKSEKNNNNDCENDNESTDSDVIYDERNNPSPKTESDDETIDVSGDTVTKSKDNIETSNEQLNDIINKNTKMFDELTTIMNNLGLNLENMPKIKNKIKTKTD